MSNKLEPGYILNSGSQEYEIIKVLGNGGFGITYLASTKVKFGNLQIDAIVAIKEHFISELCERANGSSRVVYSNPVKVRVEKSLKDFISESKRLRNLGIGHPNLVKVNEIFEANNTAYYVMEYLEGESLKSYVQSKGKLSENEMKEILTPISEAVATLHANRMTHLDIKPENIMLVTEKDGSLRPVLIDFGLSKHYGKDGKPTSTINTLGCSEGYSPSEQYSGIFTFTPEADVYALGATMYYCLTGETPRKSTELRDGEMAISLEGLVTEETLERIRRATRSSKYDREKDIRSVFATKSLVENGKDTKIEPNRVPTTVSKEERDIKDIQGIAYVSDTPKNTPQTQEIGKTKTESSRETKGKLAGIIAVIVAIVAVAFVCVFFTIKSELRDKKEIKKENSLIKDSVLSEETTTPPISEAVTNETVELPVHNPPENISPLPSEDPELTPIEMVLVEGGKFMMAYGKREVILSDFRIGKYEVTQKQWTEIMGNNPSEHKGDNLPVDNVNWYDAQLFIEKLNKKTGRDYRLPTEAEWEYAALGGSQSNNYMYSGGNSSEVGWNKWNSDSQTHPVGSRQPNELGIYDMTGNVWEWCSDWYGPYNFEEVSDPSGPSWGEQRVLRGGSGFTNALHSSYRHSKVPDSRLKDYGFRLAESVRK